MGNIKKFQQFVNETINPEDFINYKDKEPKFTYAYLSDFKDALKEYDGSFDSKNHPWGDLIKIGEVKYLLTEYGGGYSNMKSYMVFTNIEDEDDYFTVNYDSVTSNAGKPTTPFRFYSID